MKKRSFRLFLRAMLCLSLALLLPALSVASDFRPASEEQATRQAKALFLQCAFHPEYGDHDVPHLLNRWEEEVTLWVGGSPTREDLRALDAFLLELNEKVTDFPGIRRVRRDTDAAVRVWYIPQYMMKYYLTEYVEDNWGFFQYSLTGNRITSARIAIASDATEQEDRIHLLLEELVGALGLPGDHLVYRDSILYDRWTQTQELSEVDWRMLNLLYSPALRPGLTEQQAREILDSL